MMRRMKGWAREFLGGMPGDMLHWARKAEESLKVFFSPGLLFEALNFRYVGPIQGHRMDVVLETFLNVREMVANGRGPVLVHALTEKGYMVMLRLLRTRSSITEFRSSTLLPASLSLRSQDRPATRAFFRIR